MISGGPAYQRIAADLRRDILAGRIAPGRLLPSETRIHQQYAVSRLTARAAMNILRAEGLAEYVQGRGVIVREPVEVSELVPPAAATVTARTPTPEERDEYDIPDGVPVFVVTAADDLVEIYPADRWRLRWPSSGPPK